MITNEYLGKLWANIEHLQELAHADPDNRLYPMMIEASLRDYEAKQKLQIQDEQER